MKRYLVFAGRFEYPHEGARGFMADFENRNTAIAYTTSLLEDSDWDWVHVWDSHDDRVVFEGLIEGYKADYRITKD